MRWSNADITQNNYDISPDMSYIASYASDIILKCTGHSDPFHNALVMGQEFDTDNYNVVVRYDRC